MLARSIGVLVKVVPRAKYSDNDICTLHSCINGHIDNGSSTRVPPLRGESGSNPPAYSLGELISLILTPPPPLICARCAGVDAADNGGGRTNRRVDSIDDGDRNVRRNIWDGGDDAAAADDDPCDNEARRSGIVGDVTGIDAMAAAVAAAAEPTFITAVAAAAATLDNPVATTFNPSENDAEIGILVPHGKDRPVAVDADGVVAVVTAEEEASCGVAARDNDGGCTEIEKELVLAAEAGQLLGNVEACGPGGVVGRPSAVAAVSVVAVGGTAASKCSSVHKNCKPRCNSI
jgi:hypothetical protein